MFTKLATHQHFGRRHIVAAQVSSSFPNDNRFDRRLTGCVHRRGQDTLVCSWRLCSASGKLECFWEVERADTASTHEVEVDASFIVVLPPVCQPRISAVPCMGIRPIHLLVAILMSALVAFIAVVRAYDIFGFSGKEILAGVLLGANLLVLAGMAMVLSSESKELGGKPVHLPRLKGIIRS